MKKALTEKGKGGTLVVEAPMMLCKLSAKNQITLPREVLSDFEGREYFDARVEGSKIVLEPMIVRPIETARLAAIRDKVRDTGITEDDVGQMVAEARNEYHP